MTELPTSFGKYFLTEQLATGGMAEIYLAKLVGPGGFEKSLVIKQIHPRLTGQRQFVDLFVAEAKTLVSLAHGNIVPVYELGVVDDRYFIAMEYIDGPTLYRLTEALARRGERMPPALAAWIAAKVLEGLDYAHRKGDGVIHRDLSPRNVMLSRDGEVKLVDFGIAVTLGEPVADGAPGAEPTGSYPYMSPEQVRQAPLGPATDLFSAGVLLWEMLTGARLFARPTADATLAAVTDAAIAPPSAVDPDVPARLDAIVMRALERDPAARWETAAEMLGALQKFLYALEATPGPRELAALVARVCPPETRRVPTHSELTPVSELPAPPSGPSTAVVPRGRPRARTETFATNVQLEALLAPVPAVPSAAAAVVDRLRDPPSRTLLVFGALTALALSVGAVAVFLRGRDAVLASDIDGGTRADAYAGFIEPVPVDAGVDAALVDAAIDAAISAPILVDAGMRPTARLAVPADAARGDGTLRIGADPWGEITVDGTPRGRTPAQLTLPAGKHLVEIIYRGVEPAAKQTFTVELTPGETESLQADFSGR